MLAVAESRGPDEAEAPRRRGLLGAGIDRVAGAVVPAVTRSVDADELLERIDIDAVLERVDLDALLDRIDVDRLMTRIDVDALVQRVDVDSLVQRVDVDALMQRIDVQALVGRAEVGDIISQSTGQVASNTLDLVRRQVVGLDLIASRFVNRVLRRDPGSLRRGRRPSSPPTNPCSPRRIVASAGSTPGRSAGWPPTSSTSS
jgi:hypothetical protein